MQKKCKKNSRHTRQKQNEMMGFKVNRKYKDSLFRLVFRSSEALLSLYNAINGSDYQDPAELEITTIEDAVYIGVKNDVSFLIDNVMNLYEAQSTINPNMPLRGVFYFAQLYQSYTTQHGLNIYSVSSQRLPNPRYVVFYNGTTPLPDVSEYRLSNGFENPLDSGCLECVATVLNINAGHNPALMDNCRLLYEYAYFVERVRHYIENLEGNLKRAVDCAVNECIQEGVLKAFLIKHRAEVKSVILTEYDTNKHIALEKSESYREGEAVGRAKGEIVGESRFAALSLKLLSAGRTKDLERAARDEAIRQQLYQEYSI